MLNAVKRHIRNFFVANPTEDLDKWAKEVGLSVEDGVVKVTANSSMSLPPLWRAVNIICNDVGRLKFRVFERIANDDRRRATEHPGYVLCCRKPSFNHNAFQFRRLLTYHALLHGDGYARIWRNGKKEPLDLEPLPPWPNTYPVIEGVGRNRKLYYVTNHYGHRLAAIDADDVLHIHGLSYDGIQGQSVIDVLNDSLKGGISTQKYATVYFEQGGNVKGYLKVPQKLQPEQVDDMRANWKRIASGLENAHGVGVLHGGAEYVKVTDEADKAQLIDARRFTITDVSNITGVRPHDLGDQTRNAYNSLEQENQSHGDRAIEPWLITWEEECNEKLLTEQQKEDESHYCEFDRSRLIRVGLAEQKEADRKDIEMGTRSQNDLRRRDNLPPVPGGDTYRVPKNWRPLVEKIEAGAEQSQD